MEPESTMNNEMKMISVFEKHQLFPCLEIEIGVAFVVVIIVIKDSSSAIPTLGVQRSLPPRSSWCQAGLRT